MWGRVENVRNYFLTRVVSCWKIRELSVEFLCRKYLKIFDESDVNSRFFTKFAVPKSGLVLFKVLIIRELERKLYILKVIQNVTT